MKEPDLRAWAQSILFMARDGRPASDKLVNAVQFELQEIAHRYFQLGDTNGWWKEFDADLDE